MMDDLRSFHLGMALDAITTLIVDENPDHYRCMGRVVLSPLRLETRWGFTESNGVWKGCCLLELNPQANDSLNTFSATRGFKHFNVSPLGYLFDLEIHYYVGPRPRIVNNLVKALGERFVGAAV